MEVIQLSLFGKMFPERSVQTAEKTSAPCWKNLPAWKNQTLQFLDLRGGGRWSKAGAIAGNGWSLAWRQLDAQYWGVPQRRKRIALVADFGGQRAGEILFERESLPGNPDPCIPAWKEIAGLAANCPAGNDRVVGTGRSCKGDGDADCRRTETDKTGEADGPEREKRTVGGEGSEAAAYTLKIRSGCAGGGKGALVQTEKVGTLSTLQDQTLFQLISEPAYCISGNTVDRTTYQNGTGVKESKAFTVNTVDRHAVAYSINPLSSNSMKSPNPHSGFNETSVSKTLDCSDARGSVCGLFLFVQTHTPLTVPPWQSRARKSKLQSLSGARARMLSALLLRLVAR